MKRFVRAAQNLFEKMFTGGLVQALLAGIQAITPYLPVAYEIVETAVAMTPTRADDEILRLAEQLGVPAILEPDTDRGVAVGRVVFRALQIRFPGVPDRVLNRAIEIAFGAMKP